VTFPRVKTGSEIVPKEEVHVVTLEVVVEEQRSVPGAILRAVYTLESSLHLVALVLTLHDFTDTFVDPLAFTDDVNGSAFAVAEVSLEGVLFSSHGALPVLSLDSDSIAASIYFIGNFLVYLEMILTHVDEMVFLLGSSPLVEHAICRKTEIIIGFLKADA